MIAQPLTRGALAVLGLLLAACGGKNKPNIVSFAADRTSVIAGDPVIFSWEVKGADSIRIDPAPGLVQGTSVQVTPATTTSYTLTATNGAGSVSSSPVAVSVSPLAPVRIASFVANPSQVAPGDPVTLQWNLLGSVASVSIDGLGAQPAGATSVVVRPSTTTVYRLTVQGQVAPQPAPVSTIVRVQPRPNITSFVATPAAVLQGNRTTLQWKADGMYNYSISDGTTATYVGPATTLTVRPSTPGTATYALTAIGPTGASTRTTPVTVTPSLGTQLVYMPPVVTTQLLQLVRNPLSTQSTVVLDVTAAATFTANAFALNLPFDGAIANSRDGAAKVKLTQLATGGPDFSVNSLTGFKPGTNPAAAAISLRNDGPLGGVLTVGVAQKPPTCPPSMCSGAAAGDTTITRGAVLATFKLDLVPAGGKGVVFDGTPTGLGLLTAANSFKVRIRSSAADLGGGIAIGRLEAQ